MTRHSALLAATALFGAVTFAAAPSWASMATGAKAPSFVGKSLMMLADKGSDSGGHGGDGDRSGGDRSGGGSGSGGSSGASGGGRSGGSDDGAKGGTGTGTTAGHHDNDDGAKRGTGTTAGHHDNDNDNDADDAPGAENAEVEHPGGDRSASGGASTGSLR